MAGISLAQACENPQQACLAAAIVAVDPQHVAAGEREFNAGKQNTLAAPASKFMAD